MKLKKIQDKPYEVSIYEFSNCNTAFINGLRRIILTELDCVAIDKVLVYKNKQVMESEILVHRLGLLPLRWNKDIQKENVGNIRFSCDITNYDNKIKTVYNDDITIRSDDPSISNSSIQFLYPKTPITKLRKGDHIHFDCWCDVSNAVEHAKYKVVSNCFHKHINPTTFQLIIETIGNYSNDEILSNALLYLNNKLTTFHYECVKE